MTTVAFSLFILVSLLRCSVEETVKSTGNKTMSGTKSTTTVKTTTVAASSNCTQEIKDKFEAWKKKFNKTYKNPEREAKRREIFCTNFNRIQKHNTVKRKTYQRGPNIHTDKTFEERNDNLLGAKRVTSDFRQTTAETTENGAKTTADGARKSSAISSETRSTTKQGVKTSTWPLSTTKTSDVLEDRRQRKTNTRKTTKPTTTRSTTSTVTTTSIPSTTISKTETSTSTSTSADLTSTSTSTSKELTSTSTSTSAEITSTSTSTSADPTSTSTSTSAEITSPNTTTEFYSSPAPPEMLNYWKIFKISEIPRSVDYTRECTPVKDQYGCGSCWAFSAVAVVEFWRKIENKFAALSEQGVIDCNEYGYSCNGGWPYEAFLHVIKYGLSDETVYYYQDQKNNQCMADASPPIVTMDNACEINLNGDENLLMEIIAVHGPVAAVINAIDALYQYSSGVFFEPSCSNDTFNHAITIVGYGRDPDYGDYWIIRNSWSASWGINGYGWLARNKDNHCAIASYAMFPCREEKHEDTQQV